MALIGDSGGIVAIYDDTDSNHAGVRAAIEQERDKIIIPSAVLGEIDYLLRARAGQRASLQFLADVNDGAYDIEATTVDDLRRCRVLLVKYADLNLGLCDAAVVALAERLKIDTILTVDERHFRVIRTAQGRAFRLLPADCKKR